MSPRASLARLLCASVFILATNSTELRAQEVPSKAVTAVIDRARALLDNGDGAGARTLMDSLVNALPGSTVELAEALHWRAVMSESISEAERDWKRLLVEAPLSDRAADALLRLSELESLRGSATASRQHAERILMDHANSPNRPRALLLVAKGWFAENNATNACAAMSELRAVSANATGELKLQTDELVLRCTSIATSAPATGSSNGNAANNTAANPAKSGNKPAAAPAPATPAAVTPKSTPTDTPRDSTGATTPSSDTSASARGSFSVQLAAYARLADAEAMVKRLASMNIVARVDGTAAPYRVRTGRFASKAAATDALAQLTKRGIKGFVAELPQ